MPVAVALPGEARAVSVAAGGEHSLAAGSDGRLYAWGYNDYGQLGDGTATERHSPVAVALPAGVTALSVAAGLRYSLAVGSDGKVYAWGDNYNGELGDGTAIERHSPVAVALPGGARAASVAAGSGYSLATGSDGRVYAWGYNGFGQLGDGTRTGRRSPVAVALPGGARAVSVAAGGEHSLALGSDGRVYAWGYNGLGQLGNGTANRRLSPVRVPLLGGARAVSVAAGWEHSLAVGSDGRVYAWGSNAGGQLGDGIAAGSDSPVAVPLPGGITVLPVAAGHAVRSLAMLKAIVSEEDACPTRVNTDTAHFRACARVNRGGSGPAYHGVSTPHAGCVRTGTTGGEDLRGTATQTRESRAAKGLRAARPACPGRRLGRRARQGSRLSPRWVCAGTFAWGVTSRGACRSARRTGHGSPGRTTGPSGRRHGGGNDDAYP